MKHIIFTEQEQGFLRGLQENPVWGGILKKIRNLESLPRYSTRTEAKVLRNGDNPLVVETDPFRLWVYKSGYLDALDASVSLLALKPTLTREDKDD